METTVRGGPALILRKKDMSSGERMKSVSGLQPRLRPAGNREIKEAWYLPWHINCRLVESRVDSVDGNRVVGVGGVATDINNDSESPLGSHGVDRFGRDERRNLHAQVDAVDKDVDFGMESRVSNLDQFPASSSKNRDESTHLQGSQRKDLLWRSLPCPT